jgi:hypothetical protein
MKFLSLPDGLKVKVDDEDYFWLKQYNWTVFRPTKTYPKHRILLRHSGSAPLARILIRAVENEDVMFLDDDPLNCQKANLVKVPHRVSVHRSLSRPHTSRYRGVHWSRHDKKWIANVYRQRKVVYRGWFDDEEMAAHAYDEHARLIYGEQARVNFPT